MFYSKSKLYLFLILFFLFNQFTYSQTVIGKYAGEFLSLGVGGKYSALGNSGVAFVNDVTAGYLNPAGLGQIKNPQISLMHEEYFGNLANYNYVGIALPYDENTTYGLTILRYSIDGIADTRNAVYDRNGDGKIDINTDGLDYTKIKDFNHSNWLFQFSLAKKINDKWFYGASIKLISESLAEFSSTGLGFDVGVKYLYSDNLILGASIYNVTSTLLAWNTGRNELIVPSIKLGAAYEFDLFDGKVMPTLDIAINFDNRITASTFNLGNVSFDPHFGLEYIYANKIALRTGLNEDNQITFGAGISFSSLSIDYSFAHFIKNDEISFDDSHRISLLFNFNIQGFSR